MVVHFSHNEFILVIMIPLLIMTRLLRASSYEHIVSSPHINTDTFWTGPDWLIESRGNVTPVI